MNAEALLAHLVQIPSYSGHENALAAFIMDWTRKHGIQAQLQDGNVLIPFISGSDRALIFNAHMDTVMPGDNNLWAVPPTGSGAGVIKDGKLYGLGASDDKAAIASFLTLALELQSTPPPIDVFMGFVCYEETDGSGSQSFVQYFQKHYASYYQKTAAIIGEPTNLQTVEIGHRGNMFLQITTYGDTGHGSQPHIIKTHAVMEAIQAINKIATLAKLLEKKFADPILGSPSFCLTGIQTNASSPNAVPSVCTSTWDIRTTPKFHEQIMPILQKTLGEDAAITHLSNPAPYGFTAPDAPIVALLQKLVPGTEVTVSPASNDICAFTAAGINAVTFGPGQKATIHKPDEYVQLQKVEDAVGIYSALIQAWKIL